METPPTFNATILHKLDPEPEPEPPLEPPQLTRQPASSSDDNEPVKDRSEASDRLLILVAVSGFAAGFLLAALISNSSPVEVIEVAA